MARNKVFFMPHCMGGVLDWRSVERYDSIDELFDSLLVRFEGKVERKDLYIRYHTYDDRIDWNEYTLGFGRYGDRDFMKMYSCPQCAGYIAFKSGSLSRERRRMRSKYKKYIKLKEKENVGI